MPTRRLQLLALLMIAVAAADLHAQQEPFDYAAWRQFWSFKPVGKPAAPAAENDKWVRNPIDAFILARLEARNVAPAPEADKHTLIRRATFDLTGLPPTSAEIEAFIRDASPDAYEKLITRLLASPHYGERQGRHWLDVVRYEQGKVKLPGVKNSRGELDFRDYIVRSFNSDKPYDRLILEHLAGDLLPVPEDRQAYFDQLTATAFLSIGNWFDECTDPNRLKLDIIDEQINAMSKAFMGLTISCARCHDHKFDPITEKDYYALAGIFASTRIVEVFNENWKDGRLRLTREKATPAEMEARQKQLNEIDQDRAALMELIAKVRERSLRQWKRDERAYQALAGAIPRPDMVEMEAENFAGQSNLKITSIRFEEEEIEVLESQSVGEQWVRYECDIPADGRYVVQVLAAPGHVNGLKLVGGHEKHPAKAHPFSNLLAPDWKHRAWVDVGLIPLEKGRRTIRITLMDSKERFPMIDRIRVVSIPNGWSEAILKAATDAKLNGFVLEQFVMDPRSPYGTAVDSFQGEATEEEAANAEELAIRIKDRLTELGKAERIIAVADHDKPADLPVHIGGDTYRVSPSTVPRAMPVLFAHAVTPPAVGADQSGRLELAKWLTDPKHPLTARVMVNRLWQHHFGTGIVESSNDFGSRGSAPSHPELLDWLAATFIEQGWSMKKMHYLIMTSATYRQEGTKEKDKFRVPSSEFRVERQGGGEEGTEGGRCGGEEEKRESEAAKTEIRTTRNPELETRNLFSPFPRRRLEVEAIYDAMLATTGKVVRQAPGAPLDLNRSADRMMYVLTSNRSPVGLGGEIRRMFAVFDYDPTGEPIGRRDESTTAAQSLFWLNNPIPRHFAGEFAKSILRDRRFNDAELLRRAYLAALGREPDEAMSRLLLDYLKTREKQGVSREQAWTQVCLAIYASSAFRYLD